MGSTLYPHARPTRTASAARKEVEDLHGDDVLAAGAAELEAVALAPMMPSRCFMPFPRGPSPGLLHPGQAG